MTKYRENATKFIARVQSFSPGEFKAQFRRGEGRGMVSFITDNYLEESHCLAPFVQWNCQCGLESKLWIMYIIAKKKNHIVIQFRWLRLALPNEHVDP